ncbi:MAG: hypothetical protein J7647_18020 [Cyanobacteria bacterium SBLK]|nr:hypothetical protein [Cyanobacteria bacterium SBLK]
MNILKGISVALVLSLMLSFSLPAHAALFITWSPDAEAQMQRINQSFPFNIPAFKADVNQWISSNYKGWSNGSNHSKEFAVAGPAQSLQATVNNQIRNVTDYFVTIIRVIRD